MDGFLKRPRRAAASKALAIMGSYHNPTANLRAAAHERLPHKHPTARLLGSSHKASDVRQDNLPGSSSTADHLLQDMTHPQPGRSQLEMLPNEMIAMSFEALASGSTDITDIPAYRAYQDSLRSLCLVSKSIEAIARPLLYSDVRLINHMALVQLCATFCADPTLANSVKSIFFCSPDDFWKGEIRTIDLRPLRPFQDPDYSFWANGRTKARTRMPQKTREELVYNLFAKVLSRIPALESLYLKLPKLVRGPGSTKCLERLPADAEFIQQLDLQARRFQDFCEGRSLPNLAKLGTVGMLEGEPAYDCRGLLESLLRSPNLHQVLFLNPPPPYLRDTCVWYRTLRACYGLTSASTDSSNTDMCTNVKRAEIRNAHVRNGDIVTLTTFFPSLESLTIDACSVTGHPTDVDGHRILQSLGALEKLHTLELDCQRRDFAADITTESGPSTLVTLSMLSNVHTLLVPVDFFVGFTSDANPRVDRTATILPDSLKRLTLLLNPWHARWLARKGGIRKIKVARVIEPTLREIASDLLIELPHLDRVDLCFHIEDYRQHKVQNLAERSATDGGAAP